MKQIKILGLAFLFGMGAVVSSAAMACEGGFCDVDQGPDRSIPNLFDALARLSKPRHDGNTTYVRVENVTCSYHSFELENKARCTLSSLPGAEAAKLSPEDSDFVIDGLFHMAAPVQTLSENTMDLTYKVRVRSIDCKVTRANAFTTSYSCRYGFRSPIW